MAYKGRNFLILPLLALLILFSLYHYQYLTLQKAIIYFGVFAAIYLLLVSIILGFFAHPYPRINTRGPFIFYYKAYQEPYWTAPYKFTNLFNKSDSDYLMKSVQFISWYWDNPYGLENMNLCRSLLGFIMPLGNQDKRAVEIFEKLGLDMVELPQWTGVEASMRVITEYGYGIAAMKLIPVISDYVERNYPNMATDCPMYELCDDNYSTYGNVVSDNQDVFMRLKPFPDPKLNARGEKELQRIKAKKQA